jgi:REP element-mobilizing transposase RayT
VQVNAFEITDPNVNFSDHVHIIVECTVKMRVNIIRHSRSDSSSPLLAKRLRWDRADLNAYSSYTPKYLQPILSRLINIESEGRNLTDLSIIDII